MELTLPTHMVWWLSAVYIPITAAIFTLTLKIKRDHDAAIDALQHLIHTRHSQLRDSLAAYKLEVAKYYASVSDLREVERRLVSHLLRIESKLDRRTEKEIN
ncbi:MAG: hypothetical protein COB76_03160 [Alphaproteobacteria bacterium]|nr:MAG: hypothetical protein COB76_03160 [Alphaproteobacteria bacterium]